MRDIDFTMLSTRTSSSAIASCSMSNNRQVDYDGDNFFVTRDDTGTGGDIENDRTVGLSYQGKSGALGMKPFFIALEGEAEPIRDKGQFAEHWIKELDAWFKDGVETRGLTLIKVGATRLHYWDGHDECEISLRERRSDLGFDPDPLA